MGLQKHRYRTTRCGQLQNHICNVFVFLLDSLTFSGYRISQSFELSNIELDLFVILRSFDTEKLTWTPPGVEWFSDGNQI